MTQKATRRMAAITFTILCIFSFFVAAEESNVKVYTDTEGRILKVPKNNEQTATALLFTEKETIPVTPDVALAVMAQQPQHGLAILERAHNAQPGFLLAIEKNGQLVDAKDTATYYTLQDRTLVTTKQRNNVFWSTALQPDGTEERAINDKIIDPVLASELELQYGESMHDFTGKTAETGEKTLVFGENTVQVMSKGKELERMAVIEEGGMKKIAVTLFPMPTARNVRWKDTQGSHARKDTLNTWGIPTKAEEVITDAKGNKFFMKTDFANGKPSLSHAYDASGYPIGIISYDAEGKPIREKSTTVEYTNKLGKVCDPTRDYFCPYQHVQMRIKVGDKIIGDNCKESDKRCRPLQDCKADAQCNQLYGDTLRAFQKANFGIALNNAYLAARAAAQFNVKNFGFIEKFFASEFGQLISGEPSAGICGTFSGKRQSREVLIADTPLKAVMAYTAGTRAILVHPNGTKEYLYKINYFVDAQLEDITFNIDVFGSRTASIFVQDAKVPKGKVASARGAESIMQYSRSFYEKLCLRSSKGTTCNRFVDVAELSRIPEQQTQRRGIHGL